MDATNTLGFRASEVEYIGDIEILFYTNGVKVGRMIAKTTEGADEIANAEMAMARDHGIKCDVARGTMQYHIFREVVA